MGDTLPGESCRWLRRNPAQPRQPPLGILAQRPQLCIAILPQFDEARVVLGSLRSIAEPLVDLALPQQHRAEEDQVGDSQLGERAVPAEGILVPPEREEQLGVQKALGALRCEVSRSVTPGTRQSACFECVQCPVRPAGSWIW